MNVKWEPWAGPDQEARGRPKGIGHRAKVGDLTLYVGEVIRSGTDLDGKPWSVSEGFQWSSYWGLVNGYIVDGGPFAVGRADGRRASTRAEAQRVCVEETITRLIEMQGHARLVIDIGGELLEALRKVEG